jgi:hypothetical protein
MMRVCVDESIRDARRFWCWITGIWQDDSGCLLFQTVTQNLYKCPTGNWLSDQKW